VNVLALVVNVPVRVPVQVNVRQRVLALAIGPLRVVNALALVNAPVHDREPVIGQLPARARAAGQASAATSTSTIDRTLPTTSATTGVGATGTPLPTIGGREDRVGIMPVGGIITPGVAIRATTGGVR
jgi:hypothetical protein